MRTTLTKLTAIFMVVFLWAMVSQAQSPILTTATTVTACPGSTNVLVPITVQNLNGVSSISLKIFYQSANVTYAGYTAHPNLTSSGGMLLVNSPNSMIAAAFFGLGTVNIPDGEAVFVFKFNVTNSSTLIWNLAEQGACQYSDFAGNNLPAEFFDGGINAGLPDGYISSTPFICAGQPTEVGINVTSGSPPYTLVYNDGVNPDVTVTTSDNPYIFTEFITAATTYTLVSITAGGCINTINSTSTTGFYPTPEVFNVTGGGSYCNGGTGIEVGLDGSQTGVTYELSINAVTTGQYVAGTGTAISFGNQTGEGIYTISGTNDCGTITMTGQAEVTVGAGPEVTLSFLPNLCENVNVYLLTGGQPEGGVYSGLGVAGNLFYPSTIGPGFYLITYSYTDPFGCTGIAESTIEVIALPTVSLSASTPICIDSDPITLYGYPEGGVYAGPGVAGNLFDPVSAGPGMHTVDYSYSDANGCSNYSTFTIEVLPLPTVTFEAVAPVCVNSNDIQINVTPYGGWFDESGVYEFEGVYYFHPGEAGTFTFSYNYASAEGCLNHATQDITVLPLPVVTFDPIPDQCANSADYVLVASPVGGTFSGQGVVGNVFSASLVDPGYYELTYTFTDEFGCTNAATQMVYVNELPYLEVYFSDVVCADVDTVHLIGYPSGGTFSGIGVSENVFLPGSVGPGQYTITYTYTNGVGCTNFITGTITVNPMPIVEFTALSPVCLGSDYVYLQATPAGGYFEGYNVYEDAQGNWYFYASFIEAGSYNITYHYSNASNCMTSVTQVLVVNDLPAVTIEPLTFICADASPVLLQGSPAGGTFSGSGVIGDQFYPENVIPGDYYEITYSYTDQNGCSNSATTSVFVYTLPVLEFSIQPEVCINAGPVSMFAYPEGGVFSGNGVIGNTFNPIEAGVGQHVISYLYTNENGCTNVIFDTITVNPAPQAVITGLPAGICFNASPIILEGTPAGGTFSGTAVWLNNTVFEFWPEYAFIGNNIVQYQVTNEFGCTSETEAIIEVVPAPVVGIEPVADLCFQSAPVSLVGIPTGGTFSGVGVDGNTFNPGLAEAGAYNVVTYNYTNENGCSNSAIINIWVAAAPFVEINPIQDLCISSGPVQLSAYPAGGVFSGPGVANNMFDPSLAGIGTFTIEYSYTDETGCIGYDVVSVTVFSAPTVTFEPLTNVCSSVYSVQLIATPAFGYFDGPGVSGDLFYPWAVGPGTYILTYYYDAGNNCSGSAGQEITVYDAPAVTLDPLPATCLDGNAVVLNGLPAGGVYTGPGVVGNEFIPSVAGAGIFTITYTYTDAVSGCTGTASQDIVVIDLPVFTSNPSNVSIFDGENAVFTSTSTNAYFTQWQVSIDNGANWINLTDNILYSGSNSETLTITGALLAMNGYLYQNLAFGDCPTFATSSTAMLTVQSNAINVTAGVVENCAGEFIVPVSVANFYNVASMSLTLNFDNSVLTYVSYSDLNPALAGGISSINTVGNQVKLGYFNITPVSFGSGVLVNYHFTSTGGFSDLTWDNAVAGNCEFSNIDENIIPSTYVNGSATVNPLPIAYDVTGGGTYCAGTNGIEVSLSNSETGVTYQLFIDGAFTGLQLAGTGSALSFGLISSPGMYTVYAMNTLTGCSSNMSGMATVAVNAALIVDAGTDVTIFDGGSASLSAIVTGGTAPYVYSWTPVIGLDDATSANPVASPFTTTTYTVVVTDAFGCEASDIVTVFVIQAADQFSGVITYDNDDSSPMANVQVDLYSEGTLIASTITGSNGEYEFLDLPIGTYTVMASTNKTWGGGNAADGLLMLKHFVGNPLLTGLKLEAGDVTGNGAVNGHDALNTMKRFVGMLVNFAPVPDWYFESPTVIINGLSAPVVNFKAICYGDVNGDYIPPYLKPEPTITISTEGSVNVVNNQVTLPVIATQDMTIGAISFILSVPSNVTINNVSLLNGDNNLVYNRIGNELRIGWYNLVPMQVLAGQSVLNLDVRVNGAIDGNFTIDGYSTISDENAVTINNVAFTMPKLGSANLVNSLNSYPNPVSSTAVVNYTLSETGNVSLGLFNIIGEQVSVLVNASQESGSHQVILNSDELPQGSYILKLEVNGSVITQMVNIIR